VLALGCALLASITYGLGTVCQSIGARRASRSQYLDVTLMLRLAGQWPYLVGLALDAVGFVAALVALRTLPLFVVQAAIAASVGVTAVVGVFVFGFRLERAQRFALVGLAIGLGMLSISAKAAHSTHVSQMGGWLLLGGVPLVAVAGIAIARLDHAQASVGLAVCAGLSFAGVGIAERALLIPSPPWQVVFDPVALGLIGFGACGMLMFASALQRGHITIAAAVMFAVETVIPALVGAAFLGDRARARFAPVAAAGLMLALVCSIALARFTEPDAADQSSTSLT
jgi:drug/metabolite transporter (DMT)-like permease